MKTIFKVLSKILLIALLCNYYPINISATPLNNSYTYTSNFSTLNNQLIPINYPINPLKLNTPVTRTELIDFLCKLFNLEDSEAFTLSASTANNTPITNAEAISIFLKSYTLSSFNNSQLSYTNKLFLNPYASPTKAQLPTLILCFTPYIIGLSTHSSSNYFGLTLNTKDNIIYSSSDDDYNYGPIIDTPSNPTPPFSNPDDNIILPSNPIPDNNTDPSPNPTPDNNTDPSPNPNPDNNTDPSPNPTPDNNTDSSPNPNPDNNTDSSPNPTPDNNTDPSPNPTPDNNTNPLPDDSTAPPVTTDSSLVVDPTPIETPSIPSQIPVSAPNNISADFTNYPYILLSWDKIPNATSYKLDILSDLYPSDSSHLNTTSSSIILDTSCYPSLLEKDYPIRITAYSEDNFSDTTVYFNLNRLLLYEDPSGLLYIQNNANPLEDITLLNLPLTVTYKSLNTSNNSLLEALPPVTLPMVNSSSTSYALETRPYNDTIYTLNIADTSINSTYYAYYFANASFLDVTSNKLSFGEANPIQLSNARHLSNLSDLVALSPYCTHKKYFKLTTDIIIPNIAIDLTKTPLPLDSTSNFIPIGIKTDKPTTEDSPLASPNKQFLGSFDGGHHTISNLRIIIDENSASSYQYKYIYIGLFGFASGPIKNLRLDESCEIKLNTSDNIALSVAAGIVGFLNYELTAYTIDATSDFFTVSNCYNYAPITSSYDASGIIGYVRTNRYGSTTITNCYNFGTISSNNKSAGILNTNYTLIRGKAYVRILNCLNAGSIISTTNSSGILCRNYYERVTTIDHCTNTGSLTLVK